MSIFTRIPALRWLAPAAAVVLLLGGTALIRTASNASAEAASLPARTPAQLLADVAAARVDGLSGTVVETSDLGIPALPGLSKDGVSLSSLISGTHTLRVWYAGESQFRLSVLGSLGQSDVIRNGKDLWFWSSQDNAASHSTLGGSAADRPDLTTLPSLPGGTLTPDMAAQLALGAVTPSTAVTTTDNAVVAGRPAYELVLQPKDTRSLVAAVHIAVDGTEHLPIRVQVFAKAKDAPAFEIAFTAIDFARPDAAEFAFNPPPGATVTENDDRNASVGSCAAAGAGMLAGAAPHLVGTGWTSVLVAKVPAANGSRPQAAGPSNSQCADSHSGAGDLSVGSLTRVADALPTVSGTWGTGHLLTGTLMSVLLTDDGRVAAGAVGPELLYAALASK